jgi:K+-sensing histidine kinase KdpD
MEAAARQVGRYSGSAVLTAASVGALIWLRPHANLTTTALVLVLVVTVCAIAWGSGPAMVAALLSVFSFNYFFIHPIHTFTIAEPENWIAFVVFVGTALAVGQLSSRARARAEQAEARRIEIERLYRQLQEAFEKASEAETLRRSEQLKTALLDAVTHDLRTPLTSIKASVTTLLAGGGDGLGTEPISSEGQLELLEVINEESDRLNHFVEEMMTLAQLEGGQLLLHRKAIPAQDIINIAVDRASMALQHRFIEISVAPKLPALIVDGACISGVVHELLINAAKYSPPRSAIQVKADSALPGWVQITVENEGAALPAAIRERVFDKFYRGSTQKGEKQGFGLGLSIARGIVEAHGGHIKLDAAKRGTGTAVSFTVPCAAGRPGQ